MTDTTPRIPTSTTSRVPSRPHRLIERLRGQKRTPLASVHFHNGPLGAPAVCDDPRCTSPRLEI
jgi:hypothetical protein